MIVVSAFLVFLSLLCLGIGVYLRISKPKIFQYLEGKKKIDTKPCFESLWQFSKAGMSADEALKIAALFTSLGIAVGLLFQGVLLGVVLGLLSFIGGPRLYVQTKITKFKNKFDMQFPRALASFSAAAKVMPLKMCFRQVAKEHEYPVNVVFSHIAEAVEMEPRAYTAISGAAKEFDLPVLYDFADSVRALEELGGGEGATQLLDAVAEEARFKQRHRLETKGMFGELVYTMLAACGVPIFFLGLFMLDSGSDYRAAIIEMPWLLLAGFAVLIAGWVIARSLISSASRTI